jgi:hypothetical protein
LSISTTVWAIACMSSCSSGVFNMLWCIAGLHVFSVCPGSTPADHLKVYILAVLPDYADLSVVLVPISNLYGDLLP